MSDKKESESKIQYMPIYMCLGMSVGMAIGSAFDNIGIGMCLGMSIGMAIGTCLDSMNKKKSNETPENENTEEDSFMK